MPDEPTACPGERGGLLRRTVLGWEDAVDRLFLADSAKAYRVSFVLLLAIVLLAEVALLVTGCSLQAAMPWDSAYALDRAWRVYNGQRPHTDFFTLMGPVSMFFTCLGFLLGGATARAMALAPAAVFPFLSLGAWSLARRRLSACKALVFALFTAFLLIGTYPLGFPGTDSFRASYAMQHNRLGWALLCLLTLWALAPTRAQTSRRRTVVESVSAGAVLGLLLFLKLNVFAGGVLVCLVGLSFRPKRWVATVAGFAVVTLAILAYLRFDVAAFLSDVNSVRQVQTAGHRVLCLLRLVRMNVNVLLTMLLTFLIVLRPALRAVKPPARQDASARFLIGAATTVLAGLLVCSGNSQFGQIALVAVAAMLLMECAGRLRATDGASTAPGDLVVRHVLVCVLALALTLPILLPDMTSVFVSLCRRRFSATPVPSTAVIRCPSLQDLVCPPRPGDPEDEETVRSLVMQQGIVTSHQWAIAMNDAIALARTRVNDDDRVVMLEWYNPMSFALGLPSPRGYPALWVYPETVDDRHFPPFETAFADVTVVLVPKYRSQNVTSLWLLRTYGADVERVFEKVAESGLWQLRRRRE